MKKIIKSFTVLSLFFSLLCSSFICFPVKANDDIELKWKNSLDENGYPIQILDMNEEEIELYQISQLKKKYESNSMQKSGYIYMIILLFQHYMILVAVLLHTF